MLNPKLNKKNLKLVNLEIVLRNQKFSNQVFLEEMNKTILQFDNLKKWTISHISITKIVHNQIRSQLLKNFQEAIYFSKQIKKEPNFPTTEELIQDYKNYFVNFVESNVLDHISKHCEIDNTRKTILK